MNSIVPSTLSNAPTTRKTETPSSDANQPQLKFAEKSCTVTKLVDELLAAKQKEAASPFGIDDLRSHLTSFGKRFGSQPVATITIAQIDDWLRSLNVSIVTRNHYRQSIMQAFGFAVKHGYANSNPVFGRFVVSRPC